MLKRIKKTQKKTKQKKNQTNKQQTNQLRSSSAAQNEIMLHYKLYDHVRFSCIFWCTINNYLMICNPGII